MGTREWYLERGALDLKYLKRRVEMWRMQKYKVSRKERKRNSQSYQKIPSQDIDYLSVCPPRF
jgi:predicted fused transcriptional regulator/phosphomethylpyrimidine kinase